MYDDSPLEETVRRAAHAHARAIEQACIESMAKGCGVLVDQSTGPWTIEVSIAVPWGEVHYLPPRGL